MYVKTWHPSIAKTTCWWEEAESASPMGKGHHPSSCEGGTPSPLLEGTPPHSYGGTPPPKAAGASKRRGPDHGWDLGVWPNVGPSGRRRRTVIQQSWMENTARVALGGERWLWLLGHTLSMLSRVEWTGLSGSPYNEQSNHKPVQDTPGNIKWC